MGGASVNRSVFYEQNYSYIMQKIKVPLILTLAALVIVIAGLKAAASIFVPFLLALFIVVIFLPFANFLQKKGVPWWLALTLVILLILLAAFGVGTTMTMSVKAFSARLPSYNEKLLVYRDQLMALFGKLGFQVSDQQIENIFDPGKVMRFAAGALKSFSDLFSNGLMILFTAILIFIEAGVFSDKLHFIIKEESRRDYIREIGANLNNYMMIKTIVSAITGLIIGGTLAIFGLDFALLWGVVAFLLNFIPTIGSLIAAIPPVILAMVQFGIPEAAGVAGLFLFINVLMGSILEPRFMGKRLGLSVLVVFFSLVFWGWILGPVGMFLSIPLTLAAKIVLDSQEETRWLAILLGDAPGLKKSQEKENKS